MHVNKTNISSMLIGWLTRMLFPFCVQTSNGRFHLMVSDAVVKLNKFNRVHIIKTNFFENVFLSVGVNNDYSLFSESFVVYLLCATVVM